jgi:galactose mutarotase-like enzyme
MNISTSQASWYGQEAWALENDCIRTVVVPDLGAKLVSLIDKRSQLEWLVGPGDRPFKKAAYGADFVGQDMSGWDEMFPTISACDYPAPGKRKGTPLPDHGEVWPLSWVREPAQQGTLRFSVEGRALPYRLTRTLLYSATDSLQMVYELENLGRERMPYIWAAHPQFLCGDEAEIVLPPQVQDVCNVLPAEWGWGEPQTRFDWPEALDGEGQRVRIDRTGPASLNQARKFFVLPELPVSWAGLIRRPAKDWLRFDWDPNLVPYLGVWLDEGAISRESVAALEPMTGFYDSLAVAWDKKQVAMIEPGESKSWTLSLRLGTGDHPFLTETAAL